MEQKFKMMVTGRRRAGMTFAEMRRYMLNVHGPLVISDDYFRSTYIGRYVQNHVIDAGYGRHAPFARDLVSELSILDPSRLPQMSAEPHLRGVVAPDEKNFAHPTDQFLMPVSETHVVPPPPPATRSSEPEYFKAMHYLKRSDEFTPEEFVDGFRFLEIDFLRSPVVTVRGLVRNQPQQDEAPFDMVVSLWFDRHRGTDSFDVWINAVKDAGIVAADHSFYLFVAEHLIYRAE
jgi:EthD domain-containing protein